MSSLSQADPAAIKTMIQSFLYFIRPIPRCIFLRRPPGGSGPGAFGLNFFLTICFTLLFITDAYGQGLNHSINNGSYEPAGPGAVAPVDFEADKLVHDEATQTIYASGNVELVQAERILRADRVSYNLATDTVHASGNVVLMETDGTTYFADEIELTDRMKEGFATSLHGLLLDGSRFMASSGRRIGGTIIVMKDAAYTPCEICETDPSRPPVWELRAKEVSHDNEENRVTYKNAWFEFFGVPLAYVPYFSHPDGTVKRKSGFLTPSVGFDSELGTTYEQGYYWALAPDKDLTLGAMLASEDSPLFLGEYRQRFARAALEFEGGLTYSDRKDSVAGREVERDEDLRGHIFGSVLWDIDEKWRAGIDLELTSDDQYSREYDISSEDVLENEIYVERFSGRHYASGRLLGFQDVRVSERQADQPNVLPEIEAHFLGEPGQLFGGRWSVDLSALGLRRDSGGQDMNRASAELGWQRRHISGSGLVNTLDLSGRGDAYNTRDRDAAPAGSGRSGQSSEVRGFAQAHLVSSYPLARDLPSAQLVVEPRAALTAGTNIEVDNDIPNEDSQDIQLDASNLFEANRFPGHDRIEDRIHVTYGARAGIYGHDGESHAEIFLGQSHRLDSDDNPFPEGSGLSEDSSAVVGALTGALGKRNDLSYRFQLDNDSLASQRHEVRARAGAGPIDLSTNYLFAKALAGTQIRQSREQLRFSASYRLNEQWRFYGTTRHDFGDENSGLRKAGLNVDYKGQCISFSLGAERSLTSERSGDSGTEILFRLGLRNLGEL